MKKDLEMLHFTILDSLHENHMALNPGKPHYIMIGGW